MKNLLKFAGFMIVDVLKAFVVGVAASVPIGPIAILVIQKTLSKGFKPGFVTALGSTVVDTVFAVVAVFALAFVQNFIEGNSIPIFIIGGVIVIILGCSMAVSNPFRKVKKTKDRQDAIGGRLHVSEDKELPDEQGNDVSVRDFLTACAMGFSNPGAIAVMLALMAFFGIAEEKPTDWSFFPIILAIAAGSASYWLGVTALLNMFRRQVNIKNLILINRITGAVVIILGLATLAEGIMRIIILK